MFRCKECLTEYETKPQYCECGNDTFDEILPKIKNQSLNNTQKSENFSLGNYSKDKPKVEQNKKAVADSLNSGSQEKKSFLQNLPFDLPSILFFATCIILSFIIIFFVGNPKENIEQKQPNKTVKANKKTPAKIPSIDSFWDSTPPKTENENLAMNEDNQMSNMQPPNSPDTPTAPIVSAPMTAPAIPATPVAIAPVIKPQPVRTEAGKTQFTTSKTNITKPISTTSVKNTAQLTIKAIQNTTTNTQTKQQSSQPIQSSINQTQNQAALEALRLAQQRELKAYKKSLRNKIGGRINFANVIGDGSCTVAFKIDAGGKLINRSFTRQSSNMTLNDAVYTAIMSTPYFNPPPSLYKGEILYLRVTFYNGNFEISLN